MELLVRTNFERIRKYLEFNQISAYRLINQTHSFPISVDIYLDNAVIYVFEKIGAEILSQLESALHQITAINDFFYKDKTRNKISLPLNQPKQIVVNEYNHLFKINLSDYLDTGLFLDHRETRRWLAGSSQGKTVLNTFAYTGSFTIYAAKAGAVKTCSVDISRAYCDWIQTNLTLNQFIADTNLIIKMDTLDYLKYAGKKKYLFDIIILDPPTFSRNKNKTFSVQRDHPLLINNALNILSSNGFILFSTNYSDFQMQSKDISGFIKEKKDTIPPDFDQFLPHRCFIISRSA